MASGTVEIITVVADPQNIRNQYRVRSILKVSNVDQCKFPCGDIDPNRAWAQHTDSQHILVEIHDAEGVAYLPVGSDFTWSGRTCNRLEAFASRDLQSWLTTPEAQQYNYRIPDLTRAARTRIVAS